MRKSRRFFPSVEFMSARIAPSSAVAGDPTTPGSAPDTSPIVNLDDPTTGPTGDDATLIIIEPVTSPTSGSTVC